MEILYVLLIAWLVLVVVLRSDIVAFFAKMQWQKGDNEKSLKTFAFADKIGKMSADNKFVYGYIALRHGRKELARRVLTSASMSKPKLPLKIRIRSLLALIEWKDNRLPLAVEMLEDIAEDAKTTEVYQDLGLMYILSGDGEKALKLNLEAREYAPDNLGIMDNLAQSYKLCGNTEKATEIYEELLKFEPVFPEAYYGYGEILVEKGEKECGIEFMKEALKKRFTFLSVKSKEDIENMIKKYEG